MKKKVFYSGDDYFPFTTQYRKTDIAEEGSKEYLEAFEQAATLNKFPDIAAKVLTFEKTIPQALKEARQREKETTTFHILQVLGYATPEEKKQIENGVPISKIVEERKIKEEEWRKKREDFLR